MPLDQRLQNTTVYPEPAVFVDAKVRGDALLSAQELLPMLRYLLATSVLTVSSITYSRTPQTADVKIDVEDLCQYVAENPSESVSSRGTKFVYQTRLYSAAGINPHTDAKDIIRAKMQKWWSANQSKLICNVTNSIVRNGSILKLAVDRSSSEFINDAVRRWKVDLNRIDADGTTVLDFIAQQREKNRNSSRFAIMDNYYIIFSSNGAKHARDLR